MHVYEVRPRKRKRGFDLISDVLPFGRLWYREPNATGTIRDASRRGLQCPTEKCPKMIGPQVANEKTTELLTVKLQNNLYLSVVRRSFDIVIFCQ
jgi:hypothetical protein